MWVMSVSPAPDKMHYKDVPLSNVWLPGYREEGGTQIVEPVLSKHIVWKDIYYDPSDAVRLTQLQ